MNQLHKRVVVTGLGILSPIGNTVQDAWSSCIDGESGITTVDIDIKNCLIYFYNKCHFSGDLKK